MTINSISGGKTSCFLALHFPAEVNLFALVEQQSAIHDPANRWWKSDEQKRAFGWIRQFHPGFWSTAEDDNTLICLHKVSQLLESKQAGEGFPGVTVTCAGHFSGLTNPLGKKASGFDDFDTLIAQRSYLPNSRTRLCTQFLKVETIFHFCAWQFADYLKNDGKITMSIGFRLDEIERTVRLYFKQTARKNRLPNPGYDLTASFRRWRLPEYLRRWWEVLEVEQMVRDGVLIEKENNFNVVCGFDYRTPSFPLIEAGVTEADIIRFWRQRPGFPFPDISNCVGCFHHRVEELQQQWNCPQNRGKMEWYAQQEERTGYTFGKDYTYRQIQKMPRQLALELNHQWSSCDSATCTD